VDAVFCLIPIFLSSYIFICVFTVAALINKVRWRWDSEVRGFFYIETTTATELSPIENILAIAETGQFGEMLCRPYVA
jgi:hypothetical protein